MWVVIQIERDDTNTGLMCLGVFSSKKKCEKVHTWYAIVWFCGFHVLFFFNFNPNTLPKMLILQMSHFDLYLPIFMGLVWITTVRAATHWQHWMSDTNSIWCTTFMHGSTSQQGLQHPTMHVGYHDRKQWRFFSHVFVLVEKRYFISKNRSIWTSDDDIFFCFYVTIVSSALLADHLGE